LVGLIDGAGFNVPLNTLYVILGTGFFMGQITQATVPKHWRK